MRSTSTMMAIAITASVAGLATNSAIAQSGAAFFDGKTVNYVVATDPGGNYDTYGRLVAEFMQKHLQGTTFVVRNMPGAGHMIGANYIYASEPDGLTIGTFNTGLVYSQLTEDDGVRFDLSDMSWIGKAASDARVIVVSTESGIDTFEDLMALKEPVKFATCGVGCASYIETTMLIHALGMPVSVVSGYNGNEDSLAMRRGEVQGVVASRSAYNQFVAEGNGHFIAQIGGTDADVPQLSELVEGEASMRSIALVESQGDISRLTAGPPGIPADRLAALQEAYAAATSDPEFLDRAEAIGLPVDPLVGDAVGAAVAKALDQTPEVVGFLKEMLTSQ